MVPQLIGWRIRVGDGKPCVSMPRALGNSGVPMYRSLNRQKPWQPWRRCSLYNKTTGYARHGSARNPGGAAVRPAGATTTVKFPDCVGARDTSLAVPPALRPTVELGGGLRSPGEAGHGARYGSLTSRVPWSRWTHHTGPQRHRRAPGGLYDPPPGVLHLPGY